MTEIRKTNLPYVFAIAAYVILAACFALVIYADQKNSYYRSVDTQLTLGVNALMDIIPEGVHDDAISGLPLDIDDEKLYADELSRLAESLDLAYLYTIIQDGNGVSKFVLSSMTPEEIQTNTYESSYLVDYSEQDASIRPFFESTNDQFMEYSDRWGDFRSVFRAVKTSDGATYLLGADLDLTEITQALKKSLLKSLAMLFLLFVVTMPLIILIHCIRQRELESRIKVLRYDPMTGLSSRTALSADIDRYAHPQLMILDILRFSDVNSAYGPAHSDEVLCHFARHLSRFEHPDLNSHKTYRLHGDEFAVLIDQQTMPDNLDAVFADFLTYISTFEYKISHDDRIHIQIAAGVVLDHTENCLIAAKIAHQTARDGGQSLVVFSEDLPQASKFKENLVQQEMLQKAIDEDRLTPWFQPIFYSDSLSIKSYEALARIVDENGDVIAMPSDFLPVAHRYKAYYKVTREILRKSVEWARKNNTYVSINLSIRDIEHRGTRDYILNTIQRSGMGKKLSFELLESEAIRDIDLVLAFFDKLKALGCRLGIDDLGKEYSNFDRLMSLPLDFIKLDGALIRHVSENKEALPVVQNIVSLAQTRKLMVTAEVISCKTYLDIARQLAVDHVQGFYVGLPAREVFQ